ncbi:MAG: ATP-binding protein [Desulfobacteraceae bacterium]|jgi:CO dehydrogenase maturation factor|nr:MAG: ATP-binding protein [Desulfobacteraceae bacterium]
MIRKGYAISVSGKGGVGKTNLSALLIKCLCKSGSVLAIDADPDANLSLVLGANDPNKSVGHVREMVLNSSSRSSIGEDKAGSLERILHETIEEYDTFDLIVMGRPEGEGCYCAVNNIIRHVIDQRSCSYDYVVIDCEPGLEHLSRRTTKDVDLMIVVTDATKNGVLTARRIYELKEELLIKFSEFVLLANKITAETKDIVTSLASQQKMEIEAYIPYDPFLYEADVRGLSLIDIPESSGALIAVKTFVEERIVSLNR